MQAGSMFQLRVPPPPDPPGVALLCSVRSVKSMPVELVSMKGLNSYPVVLPTRRFTWSTSKNVGSV